MKKIDQRATDVRVEVVTTTFVASGRPEGMLDLGRFIEQLNNWPSSQHMVLMEPAVRPLYRASNRLHLDAPLLIKRDEIVFANFEGPTFTAVAEIQSPVLVLAPPFQIQGNVAFAPGTDPALALQSIVSGFFVMRKAGVFDAEGNALGEGEQIIINGGAVQMTAATRQHIDVAAVAHRIADAAPDADTVSDAASKRRAA